MTDTKEKWLYDALAVIQLNGYSYRNISNWFCICQRNGSECVFCDIKSRIDDAAVRKTIANLKPPQSTSTMLSVPNNMPLALRPIENERDFVTALAIESMVAKENLSTYTSHPSCLVFDRYLYGNGSQDIFTYGKLVSKDGVGIGYVLAYLAYSSETEFVIRLLPQYSVFYAETIKCVENSFPQKNKLTVIANNLNTPLCEALDKNGFVCENEERWQSVLDLSEYVNMEITWQDEVIEVLSESDIDARVTYADIPTGEAITRNMYETLIASEYYNSALDYVVRNAGTNEFIGFITWWIDEDSKTATLEPVACLPEYRRRGIMKRALLFGLNELKRCGLRYAYVSTSIHNEKSQPLYKAVGFHKVGTACQWVKERNV
jgi:RimJ/RimL family protein N-acetyltransferase